MIAQHPAEQIAVCFIEMASTTFGEPLVLLFVARAAVGEPLTAFFVASAANLKPQVPERVAKRSIVTLESNVMLVFRSRRKKKSKS